MEKREEAKARSGRSLLGWTMAATVLSVTLVLGAAVPAGADEPTASANAPEATATAPAAAKPETAAPEDAKPATATAQTAKAAPATKPAAADLPGRADMPLVAKASRSGTVEPVSFTVRGMKYLSGRPLRAGEFSFKMSVAGRAVIPAASKLAAQLRPESGLSAAEKYALAADLTYFPCADQPAPASTVVDNTAEGAVVFPALTFNGAAVGATATQRSMGAVFCYTVAELAPRDSQGALLEGVTRDPAGRYVYQGVTYDDTVKRVYLYVYQTVDGAGNAVLAVAPLGDAAFDAMPGRSASGEGVGFLNTFKGARLKAYDGTVYLDGASIEAGEFRFDVREVTEDGTVLDEQSVACDSAETGSAGAEIPLIRNAVYDGPTRVFYAVSQTAAPSSAASAVVLDETSYVITVEVTQNDQDALDAAITYVRKKPAGSDTWVDVGTAGEPGPVVWENRLRAESPDQGGAVVPDKPDAPDDSSSSDKPSTPGEDAGGDDGSGTIGGVTAPVGPGGGSTENGAPSDGDGAAGATPEAPGSTEGADRPADGGERPAGTDGTKPGADGAKPGTASPDGRPDDAADGAKHDSKKDDGAKTDGAAVSKPAASDGGTVVEGSVTGGAFAQTGDDLGIPMLIAFLVVVVSGVALAVVSRRRPPRS